MRPALKIRDLDLGLGVLISPMVGVTDLPFRRLCRRFGADLTHCEMIAGPTLIAFKNGKIKHAMRIIATEPDERPFAVQLFGSIPDALAAGAAIAVEYGADLVDLNMGCPTRKVAGNGSGSGLLREPENARRCIAAIRAAAPGVPFTVKIRAGWDPDNANAAEIARIAEGEGVDSICVHGRFRSQSYGEAADWTHIRRVKQAVSVPVIGNGGVMTGDDVRRLVDETGCDGVMLARGVLGNPWLIPEARAVLLGEPVPPRPRAMEKWEVVRRFWEELAGFRGLEKAVRDVRKHLIWFTRGLHRANDFRADLHMFVDPETLVNHTRAFFEQAHEYEETAPADLLPDDEPISERYQL
ncbi:tRNA dihydrouridine synthase DusB [bacterium]|nr:tRNA dihydrouridine synthase DusB [bacterium]